MYSAQGQNQLQSRRFLANLLCWTTFLPASWMMAQSTQQPPPRPSPSPRKLPPTFRPDDPYEVSAVVTGLQGNGLGNDFGSGGRFTYTYSEHDDSEIGTVSAWKQKSTGSLSTRPPMFFTEAGRCWPWRESRSQWAIPANVLE